MRTADHLVGGSARPRAARVGMPRLQDQIAQAQNASAIDGDGYGELAVVEATVTVIVDPEGGNRSIDYENIPG